MKERHSVMTCARCGQPLQPGTPVCPRCGLPLTPPPMPPMAQTPQPPYGQPYGQSYGQSYAAPPYAGAPAAEPAMPDWLRALQGGASAQTGTPPGMAPGAQPPQAPAAPNQPWAMPSIPAGGQPGAFGMPAGGPPPPQSLSMSSLINNDVLPDWMRGAPAAPSPTPMPVAPWGQSPEGPMPRGVTPPPAGQSAAMFDEAALPDWLRAAAAQPGAGGYAPAANFPPGGAPNGFAPTPGGPFAANPYAPPAAPYAPPAAPSPFQVAPPGGFANGPANGGMAGPPLFDAAALPSWLGGTATPSTPLLQEMPAGASGLAANTLVDPNVLPQWMRDARSPQQEPSGPPAGGTVSEWLANPVTDEPLPGFLDQIYAAADVPRLDQAAPDRGMVGEQIVDAGALPAWLRAPAAQAASAAPAGSGAPMPPPIMPAPAGFGAPDGSFADGSFADGAAGGPVFSARDLVEPDALPAWAQQGQGQAMDQPPTSAAGDRAADWPDAPSSVAAPRAPDSAAPAAWAEPDEGAAFATGASQPGTSWPPRGDHASIPEAELPPWLREGQPAAAGTARAPIDPLAGPPESPEGYAGFEEFQGFDAGDMPMDPAEMQPPEAREGSPSEHYADRFGAEMPGGSGRFGYQYDYGAPGALAPPEAAPAAPAGQEGKKGKGGKRKGFFRRR